MNAIIAPAAKFGWRASRRPVPLLAALTMIFLGSAAEGQARYGNYLIATMLERHPSIASIRLRAIDSHGQSIDIAGGAPAAKAGTSITLPLRNAAQTDIGTATLSLRGATGRADAARIGEELSRRIYLADNLGEPDPWIKGAHRSREGQRLVEAFIDSEPRLLSFALHVGTNGHPNRIAASNFGRIGKLADKDDQNVIDGGEARVEMTDNGRRIAVELPMLDRQRRTIGALSTSFPAGDDAGRDQALADATRIRDRLATLIRTEDDVRGD